MRGHLVAVDKIDNNEGLRNLYINNDNDITIVDDVDDGAKTMTSTTMTKMTRS